MTVPVELQGAWRRSGLFLDGRRVVDYCDVLWLQTPEWFVDIRLLIDPNAIVASGGVPDFFYAPWAFAGVTSYDAPTVTWEHRFDSHPGSHLDSNPIRWQDGIALEEGHATIGDTPCTYAEEWLRMTGDDVTWRADVDGTRARIEVGRFAVDLSDDRPSGSFRAARCERAGDGWAEVGAVDAVGG
jgi:hypothetical protein